MIAPNVIVVGRSRDCAGTTCFSSDFWDTGTSATGNHDSAATTAVYISYDNSPAPIETEEEKPIRPKKWFIPKQEKWINFSPPKILKNYGKQKGSGWRLNHGRHVLRIC